MRNRITFTDRATVDSRNNNRCPKCGDIRSRVTDTSAAVFGAIQGLGRRRRCMNASCNNVWRTIEITPEELEHADAASILKADRLETKLNEIRKIMEKDQ